MHVLDLFNDKDRNFLNGGAMAEGGMPDVNLEYEDYLKLPPMAFQSRYKMSKEAWAEKYKNLLPKPAPKDPTAGMPDAPFESNDQLDELSPKTLASYVRKSDADARDKLKQDPKNQFKKAEKRVAGIGQAIGKIRATMEPATAKAPGVEEGSERVDTLVTKGLPMMRDAKWLDAVAAIKYQVGERDYRERKQFYDFFVQQLVDKKKAELAAKKEGVAEGYDPVESDYQQWEDILVKDGYRGDPSGAYALKLVVGHQLMSDPAEVASTIRNILTYVKQNRQVLGKAVSDRTTVKDAIIDIKNKFPQQYQASQQPQGVAEGYQLDEGAVETITALVKKIPGIGKYYQMAQQYKPQLIQILKTSKSGKEVKQKMEQLIASQSVPVAESGMMKQLGGLAVGGGSILSTMWMNAMGMIDGVLAHAAAGEVGGAVASGSILGLIPVTLMLFAAMLLFKGSQQSSDEKAQAFQAQRGQQGMREGKRNLKCVCKTHGTMQCPVHTPKDIEVIEGAKVDRMVKHVAQSEKKLGHSKKEAENIAWATANKRGMLNNKNKKA